jgi:UDP-3-O-[3-hydroxymyristoyl] glucosamine N-acyltransferase
MKTLTTIATHIGAKLTDPARADLSITRVAAFSNAGPNAIVFVEQPECLQEALASGAGAVIAPFGVSTTVRPLLLSDQPRLAFARAARFLGQGAKAGKIHSTANIDHQAHLGNDVSVGAHAAIGAARIGDRTIIGAGACIADHVIIGKCCVIHANVVIYCGTTIGDKAIIHAGAILGSEGFGYVRDPATGEYLQFPQQGTLVIEDNVEIGANTTIDRGALEETRIGSGTKLDNLVHVGHNCRIGKNVVIASQTGISGSCVIGDGVIMGGQVGMGDHVTIGNGVILGGGAGILPHKKLHGEGQVFWGTPAKPLKQYLKELATLSRLARTAPEPDTDEPDTME